MTEGQGLLPPKPLRSSKASFTTLETGYKCGTSHRNCKFFSVQLYTSFASTGLGLVQSSGELLDPGWGCPVCVLCEQEAGEGKVQCCMWDGCLLTSETLDTVEMPGGYFWTGHLPCHCNSLNSLICAWALIKTALRLHRKTGTLAGALCVCHGGKCV